MPLPASRVRALACSIYTPLRKPSTSYRQITSKLNPPPAGTSDHPAAAAIPDRQVASARSAACLSVSAVSPAAALLPRLPPRYRPVCRRTAAPVLNRLDFFNPPLFFLPTSTGNAKNTSHLTNFCALEPAKERPHARRTYPRGRV